MSVITIGNFKGGVGKTTVSTLLSYIGSERYDKRILLVDFDPQGNATPNYEKNISRSNR
ncbi:chromosome partitioning ATPase [Staphylococcus aureus]|nr:chromosome partitioning ATPase [Staphylococcus aureus]